MVYFKTKNPNLGLFWRALEWKMLVYFMAIRYYHLCPFGVVCGRLVYFVVLWYIFPVLVCLGDEKSGNPACDQQERTFPSVQISFCNSGKQPLHGYSQAKTMEANKE
jgi:hypothetical protein